MDFVLDRDFTSFYRPILEFFRDETFGPRLATGLLFVASLCLLFFLISTSQKAMRLRSALRVIKGTSNLPTDEMQKRQVFATSYSSIDAQLSQNKLVSHVWREFRETLLFGNANAAVISNSIRPQSFFTSRTLHVQYDLIRSLPNFFVGIGLLGTFVGLIAALTFSTQSLTSATNQAEIKDALSTLLTTAAAKFYISAAGLVSSIVLALVVRLILKWLNGLIHKINDELEVRLVFVNEHTVANHILDTQKQSLDELKLFNTDIAMSIGNAVRSAIEQGNSRLTDKLSTIVESFSQLVEASRQGAGEAIGKAVEESMTSSLYQASEAIRGIASGLQELPNKLASVVMTIQEAGRQAAEQHEIALTQSVEATERAVESAASRMSEHLTEGTRELIENLHNTGDTFGASASKIGEFIELFAANGDEYMKSLSGMATQNGRIEENLKGLSGQLISAADGVTKATSSMDRHLEKVLTGLDTFARVATESNAAIRAAQEAVQTTVAAMQEQMQLHIQRFDTVDEKLATVFKSIGNQLIAQSTQMSERLTDMDQALASAVNEFSTLIDNLGDVLPAKRAAQ